MNARPRDPRALATACLALLLLLALAACGPDDPAPSAHGLKAAAVESNPTGDPIQIAFELEDGAQFTAEVRMKTDIWQRTAQDGPTKERTATASAVLELQQTFAVPGAERPPSSRIRLVYTSAEGKDMQAYLKREPITGTLEHAQSGPTRPGSLRLSGGTATEREEARDRLAGLYLAGFAGSPAWLPDRPVRVGEAWAAEGFLEPRGIKSARQQARQLGLDTPEPTFSGSIRVVGISEGSQGQVLELEIDTLIEIAGRFRKGRESGRMSYANQVRGTALVSVRTGLPESFEATEVVRTDIRQGQGRIEQRATATIYGTVARTN